MRISGFNVKLHMNITDIDDKIIAKSLESGIGCSDTTQHYEKLFFQSMSKLNVELPDKICRVSDVIPEIISYIQKIIDNGFAYISASGSIYFDTDAYIKAGYKFNHRQDHQDLYSVQNTDTATEKTNVKDFVLWKSRMENEIGCYTAEFNYADTMYKIYGRPGWHIECSTIINEIIGSHLDVHLGGIDLKFPHHHNEIIQANAYHHPKYLNSDTWCDEFMHVGHLNISAVDKDGSTINQKMSKSLKNFTTIDSALMNITPNQLRLIFMEHNWKKEMTFTDNTVRNAIEIDNACHIFFGNTRTVIPLHHNDAGILDLTTDDEIYFTKLNDDMSHNIKTFDFNSLLKNIRRYISRLSTYSHVMARVIQTRREFLLLLLTRLGFAYDKFTPSKIAPVMDLVVDHRKNMRTLLGKSKNISTRDMMIEIYSLLDSERNDFFSKLGIKIEDVGQSSKWTLTRDQ